MSFSRRDYLKLAGAGLVAAQSPSLFAAGSGNRVSRRKKEIPFELGIASYTFKEFTLEETIAMTSRMAIKKLCLKDMHMPLDSSPEQLRETAAKVRNAGIDLYGAGVIYMRSEEEVHNAFAYAGYAGLKVIVGVPEYELLGLCNSKVKETGIRLAIHNHGPGDDIYPSPASVYERIRDLDPRIGLCVDIGHTTRIGQDPTVETEKYIDRVLDIHIKDEDKADPSGEPCEIGRGVIDIPGFLQMLLKMDYNRVVSFEYEKDADDPLAGLAESTGYVRGVLDLLA